MYVKEPNKEEYTVRIKIELQNFSVSGARPFAIELLATTRSDCESEAITK